jgi:D-alanyl-lipoteichoic acid acyltransferase DltB (MBOAT superfamily)
MNFAEFRFWGYLLAGLAVVLLVRRLWSPAAGNRRDTFDKLGLLTLGLFLLLCVSWVTFVIYLAVALGSYVGLKWLLTHDPKRHRHYLWILIPLQLLPLAYYKYANFAANQVLGLDVLSLRNLAIPVGISFYTFQKVAFVIDTLAFQQPLPRFRDYMNFAGFFPQIVAGPIERRNSLLPQMEVFRFRWSLPDIDVGAGWIVVGLFFKLCLADNLAGFFDGTSHSNAYLIWMANLIFGLRIYYDFAGYSLIALGLGRCLGVRLTLNFCSPYCSTSIGEFWHRWHITLCQWFRDYLYIPLGGGRVAWWAFNVGLVFVVSGIWHGAGWNFMLWGAIHGTGLILNRLFGPKLKLPSSVCWLLTMTTCFGAWLAFYETRTDALFAKARTLLTPSAYNVDALHEARQSWSNAGGFVMVCFLALSGGVLLLEWLCVRKNNPPYRLLFRPAVLVLLIILTVILAPGKNNGFIYFAF